MWALACVCGKARPTEREDSPSPQPISRTRGDGPPGAGGVRQCAASGMSRIQVGSKSRQTGKLTRRTPSRVSSPHCGNEATMVLRSEGSRDGQVFSEVLGQEAATVVEYMPGAFASDTHLLPPPLTSPITFSPLTSTSYLYLLPTPVTSAHETPPPPRNPFVIMLRRMKPCEATICAPPIWLKRPPSLASTSHCAAVIQ